MPDQLYVLDTSGQGQPQFSDRGGIVEVDFGDSGSDIASVVVTSKPWVTASTRFICSVCGETTDHPDIEDALLEGLRPAVADIIAGTGYTVYLHAPNGPVTGSFYVHVLAI